MKYSTRKNTISRQSCKSFIPKFHVLCKTDPAIILTFLKESVWFSRKLWLSINKIPCASFSNCACNNRRQIVIFTARNFDCYYCKYQNLTSSSFQHMFCLHTSPNTLGSSTHCPPRKKRLAARVVIDISKAHSMFD